MNQNSVFEVAANKDKVQLSARTSCSAGVDRADYEVTDLTIDQALTLRVKLDTAIRKAEEIADQNRRRERDEASSKRNALIAQIRAIEEKYTFPTLIKDHA